MHPLVVLETCTIHTSRHCKYQEVATKFQYLNITLLYYDINSASMFFEVGNVTLVMYATKEIYCEGFTKWIRVKHEYIVSHMFSWENSLNLPLSCGGARRRAREDHMLLF